MTKAALIPTSLGRRSLWLAGAIALLLILTLLIALNRQSWRNRAAALERDNLDLRLGQLQQEVSAQSENLARRVRELAESDAAIRLLQETTDPSADRLELADRSRDGVDALLVLSAAHVARFSVAIADGQLSEQPPDPILMPLIEAAAVDPSTDASRDSTASFKDDRWIAVRPVIGHASPVILGWVAASRSLNNTLLAQFEKTVGGSLSVRLPSRGQPGSPAASIALRDAGGRVSRLLEVTRSQTDAAASAASLQPSGGTMGYVLAVLLFLLASAGAGGVALRRHFRHQRSVDARYKALIDQANDGIVIVDAHTYTVLYTNPAFLNRLGYSNEEAQALTLTDIFIDGNSPPESVLARLVEADFQMALNLQQRCKNGSFFDTEVRCNTLDVDGRDVLAFVTHDVSLRRKAEQQLIENQQRLDKMAHHDQLTGLPNRHYLTSFLPEAIAEAKAAGLMLGVVFLDLDRFKHINDTRGHETGDKLLQEVATRLRACVRESDVIIRMGGDEFVVVFRNVRNYDEVTLGAGRIIETLNSPIVIDRHPLQTTGSVGVSLYPRDGADMIELLKHSDTAMYQAKDRGRNNVQMFSHAMNRKLKHRVAVEASLREALRLKQLDVHYQPFVNLITRKIVGLEALMRWSHPVHGMIPADQFIPVAEETGLIVPMGNFVLHRTLQTMSAWRKAGIPLVPVSVNVAPAQLQRGELQSTISALLKTHNLRPDMLLLEMTERAVFDSHSPAGDNRQDTMAKLRDLGIKIAIDDFGTGYSSLSYLKNWRVDMLKIDRSFVRDLVTDSSDLAIVSAIIAIARHLHIEVIAEGIEAYQQVEILRRLGCTVGQGFLFARPMPADDILKLLRDEAEPAKEEEEDMLAVFSAGRG
jgi:diguanylate cyclase (GGDEF)-like protein/PAS domain S-box-containing protein